MLPNLGGLSLESRAEPTGEFIRLSRAEARKLNNAGVREPINKTKYLPSDCEPTEENTFNQLNRRKADDYECFEPFKVWIKDERTDRPGRQYNIYNAEALWDALPYMDKMRDPATRQPFWREDWWELHQKFDPNGDVPREVHMLPRKDKHEGYDTEDDDETDDELQDEALLQAIRVVEQRTLADRPVEVWGRFWLKGNVAHGERYNMENWYFGEHLKRYIRNHGIGQGITVNDISSIRFMVRTYHYATPASQGPLQGDAQMPVTCVDFELLFNRRSKAQNFLGWFNAYFNVTQWHTIAEEMFGISVLDVGQPYSEIPEIADPAIPNRYFGGMLRVPIIHRSRYNDAERWEIGNVYDVPFSGNAAIGDDGNDDSNDDSDSEPDWREEQMSDYYAMVADGLGMRRSPVP